MRVVIVNKYAHLTGGADQHCLGLASALSRRGHEVRFLSTRDAKNAVDDGVFVTTTVTHGSREAAALPAQAAVLAKAIWNHEAAMAMRRLIDEFRPDVVHTHKLYPQLSVAPVIVAARAGVPVVQTLHDFEMISASPLDARGGTWDSDESRLRYKLLNTVTLPLHRRVHAPRVSAFVAVSRFVARVHARHGVDATVLPNFVSTEEGQPPSFDDRSGVVFVGRLRAEKGALDAVKLARRLPTVPVTIVGEGELEGWIRSEAKRIRNLHVAGFVPNTQLVQSLRNARVVIAPSRWQEPGSLVALEAMGNATPVVAYSVGGLAEYVSDAGGGRVVPIDIEALIAATADLHEDREQWETLARNGRTAVAERHAPQVYAERVERLYESVAKR
jgi:glycosyltransferase involved in cell wall biosynthesis